MEKELLRLIPDVSMSSLAKKSRISGMFLNIMNL